jgi:hypothetical protein
VESDSTSSIDLSVAFFSSVLVLFVFVSFVVAHHSAEEKPAIGQKEITSTVLPAGWDPYPQRTRYALAYDGKLSVLDLKKPANALAGLDKKIFVAGKHFDNSRLKSRQPDPSAVLFQFETTGEEMPQGIVEQSVKLDAMIAKDDATSHGQNCTLTLPASNGGVKPPISVYIDSGDDASLEKFLQMATICKFEYRILLLRERGEKDDPMVLNFARLKEFFTSEKLFR